MRAAERGHAEAVELLVAHGVDPAYAHPFSGWTAATTADANGHLALAERLVELGAPAASRFAHGYSELHRAVSYGEVLPLLDGLDPSDADVVDAAVETPLLLAVRLRREGVAAALLTAGADPNTVNDDRPIFAEAAYHDSRPDEPTHLVERLLAAGADVNPRGYPPLFNTVNQEWSSATVFRRLIATGADIAARAGWEDETVLHRIAAIDDAPMIDLALDAGADIEARDCFGRTPLNVAANTPNLGTFARLVERGADLDARGADGETFEAYLDAAAAIDSSDAAAVDEIRAFLATQ